MLKKDDVLEVVKALELPADNYLVYSGAVLAACGIRKADDVDILVSEEFFEKLKEMQEWKSSRRRGTKFLRRGVIEIASRIQWDDYEITLQGALQNKNVIDGVPFMSLKDVVQFKRALDRPKDQEDIELINAYRESKAIYESWN